MLQQRAVGAAILVPPIVLAFALGERWIAGLVVLLTAAAAIEAFRLLAAAGYRPLILVGTVFAVALAVESAFADAVPGGASLIVAGGVIVAGVATFAIRDPRDGVSAWGATVFGALYVALLAFVVRLGQAAPAVPPDAALAGLDGARAWILVLVLGVWAYDTGAWLVGRTFGRRRFLEHLSPSKTYAGLVGGLVASTIAIGAVLAGIGASPLAALVLGPLVGLAAQAGDLAESMLKRAAGAKDSGRLIPGHGGILDRVDSFLFAAPVVTLYVVAAYR